MIIFLQEAGMKVVVCIYYYFRMYSNHKATIFFHSMTFSHVLFCFQNTPLGDFWILESKLSFS